MFDRDALGRAIAAHGCVARVVVAAVQGHGPREVGAAMLVWHDGQDGSIGGGTLEWQAVLRGREMLAKAGAKGGDKGGARLTRAVLGPDLGQCCGGVVTLLTEVYGSVPDGPVVARATDGSEMPLAVKRLLTQARGQGVAPQPQLTQGWMIEPVVLRRSPVWIWGAGHVGRALVSALSPLPDLALTWVDVADNRFPLAPGVHILPVTDPANAVALAPADAFHIIVTLSHALDLELCHRLLAHGFAHCGLIGSSTKWARFRSRLASLGHREDQISTITCPIGNPALGKHPQAIAIGVAAQVLNARLHKGLQGDLGAEASGPI